VKYAVELATVIDRAIQNIRKDKPLMPDYSDLRSSRSLASSQQPRQ